jgi:hypothetical protein
MSKTTTTICDYCSGQIVEAASYAVSTPVTLAGRTAVCGAGPQAGNPVTVVTSVNAQGDICQACVTAAIAAAVPAPAAALVAADQAQQATQFDAPE